jgi:hypothetical protein
MQCLMDISSRTFLVDHIDQLKSDIWLVTRSVMLESLPRMPLSEYVMHRTPVSQRHALPNIAEIGNIC